MMMQGFTFPQLLLIISHGGGQEERESIKPMSRAVPEGMRGNWV